jgi:hypothetical protein
VEQRLSRATFLVPDIALDLSHTITWRISPNPPGSALCIAFVPSCSNLFSVGNMLRSGSAVARLWAARGPVFEARVVQVSDCLPALRWMSLSTIRLMRCDITQVSFMP